MERVDISILGRDYSLACEPEEKADLVAATAHVAQLAGRIQGSSKISGNERIAVMVAIQLASELLGMKVADHGAGGTGGMAVGEFKRKIDHMNGLIDGALQQQ